MSSKPFSRGENNESEVICLSCYKETTPKYRRNNIIFGNRNMLKGGRVMESKVIYGGPGSGKTRRLVKIFTELLDSGTNINDIQAVAFNRSVADEIAFRIEETRGKSVYDLRKTVVSTFHGFCRRLLSTEFEITVLPPWKIASEFLNFLEDRKKFTKSGREKEIFQVFISLYELYNEVKPKVSFWSYCLQYLRRSISHSIKNWSIADARRLFQEINFTEIYTFFTDWRFLQTPLRLSFQELQTMVQKKIDMFKNKKKFLLTDENQDFSPTQWSILNSLNGTKICVGDDDQSVYKYRGADPKFFLSLPFEKVILKESYRYDTEYAQALERGIKSLVKHRQPKIINGLGSSIKIHNFIPQRIEKGVVLARTNKVLRGFSLQLTKNAVPHILEESSILGQKTSNPVKQKFKRILVFLNSRDITEFAENVAKIIRDKGYSKKENEEKIRTLKSKHKDYLILFELMKDRAIGEKLRLCQRHSKLKKQADELTRITDIERFLADVENPQLTLSTVHRFKGRENDFIYIINFDDGFFPMRHNDFEEEVRIAYVALSRVKKELYIDGNSFLRSKFLG